MNGVPTAIDAKRNYFSFYYVCGFNNLRYCSFTWRLSNQRGHVWIGWNIWEHKTIFNSFQHSHGLWHGSHFLLVVSYNSRNLWIWIIAKNAARQTNSWSSISHRNLMFVNWKEFIGFDYRLNCRKLNRNLQPPTAFNGISFLFQCFVSILIWQNFRIQCISREEKIH